MYHNNISTIITCATFLASTTCYSVVSARSEVLSGQCWTVRGRTSIVGVVVAARDSLRPYAVCLQRIVPGDNVVRGQLWPVKHRRAD